MNMTHTTALPTLVLLHAFPFSSGMWLPQVAGLGTSGVPVLTPDQRGLANGAADPGPYTLDDVADDVARFLDEQGLGKVVLGGLSMGGLAALRLLARRGGRRRGLGLSRPAARRESEEGE